MFIESKNFYEYIQPLLEKENFVRATLSQSPNGVWKKITVQPLVLKEKYHIQCTFLSTEKVRHENMAFPEELSKLISLFEQSFQQLVLQTTTDQFHFVKKKKGFTSSKISKRTDLPSHTHNRKKSYILEEGSIIPYLVSLGIMDSNYQVKAKKHDKFKQINRFLEMVDDILPNLPTDQTLRIVDFGCGKSYLTFALYDFLTRIKQKNVQVLGLDTKKEVIKKCQKLAESMGYSNLEFQVKDIKDYVSSQPLDLVVSLHACDIATDLALNHAVRSRAKVILCAPCCQHELFSQVSNPILEPLLSYGIFKERFASLITDAARVKLLNLKGYHTQVLEFVDVEHTPKNIMIRATLTKNFSTTEMESSYQQFKEFLNIHPHLEKILLD